ncbi:MAG: hypothetical protein SH818_01980 [Saprospiraceae bacterium]|nr:hypothetical protein [Saprospiraceae bacterium]
MHRLPFILIVVLSGLKLAGQSPHGQQLRIDCSQCHTANSWTLDAAAIRFDHDSTSFRLRGQHQRTDCKACHSTLVFSEAPSDCLSCHQDLHGQSLGNDCARCHNSNSWIIENVSRMHELVSFPLLGNHAAADCMDCHLSSVPLRFERIGTACINCHEMEYLQNDKLDHKKAGFSTECAPCHDLRASSWAASFNHAFFPLTKGHDIQDCNKCHTNGYSGTSAKCIDCHTMDFNNARNPNHNTLNLSSDCASCHTTALDWTPAGFPIHNQIHKLEGAHARIINQCAECHQGNYTGNTPKTCFGCHSTDYNATKNPNHKSANFPTNCDNCHSQNTWSPATFNHDNQYFRIYSGKHKGEWSLCAECHTSPGNFSSFSCIDCHEHNNKSNVDKEHKNISGYSYTGTSCYTCHRNE